VPCALYQTPCLLLRFSAAKTSAPGTRPPPHPEWWTTPSHRVPPISLRLKTLSNTSTSHPSIPITKDLHSSPLAPREAGSQFTPNNHISRSEMTTM
jgi:hypothetical protein